MVNGIPLNGYATDIAMDMQASPTVVANNVNLINLGKSIYKNRVLSPNFIKYYFPLMIHAEYY